MLSQLYYFIRASLRLLLFFLRAMWQAPRFPELSREQQRRIRHYHYGCTYLAALMCSLRGSRMQSAERISFGKMAALAAFFDDMVESTPGSENDNTPEQYGAAADTGVWALQRLQEIRSHLSVAQRDGFNTQIQRVFQIEREANRLPVDDTPTLRDLCREKGAASVLLFRSLLSHPLRDGEAAALHHFGHLIQLCDDIFDLWHDRQKGTKTFVCRLAEAQQLDLLQQYFEQTVQQVEVAWQQCDYPPPQQRETVCITHFLVSITRVCLIHYQHLLKSRGFLPLDERQNMVVDMEKWSNRWAVLGQLWRSLTFNLR